MTLTLDEGTILGAVAGMIILLAAMAIDDWKARRGR